MPTGTIIIGTIGPQSAGVPFTIAGTYALSGGSFVEQLVYKDDAGTSVPISAPVVNLQTASWTLSHPGLPVGTHTISIRDKLTGALVVSNSFVVGGTASLAISPIPSQNPGATFTLSGSYTNFPAAPALTYTIDGGTSLPVTTVGGGTFSTTATAPATLGPHTAVVSASGAVSPVALFTVAAVVTSIAFTIPTGLAPSQVFTFTGTLSGYATAPALTYSFDGAVPPVAITGVTPTGWSMSITAPATPGSHTIVVTDGTNPTPVTFTVTAVPKTIAPSQPASVIAGAAFTFTGVLAGYATIPALSYRLDGAAPVNMTGVSVTGWSMSVTIPTVGSHTLVVSDTFGTAPGSTTFTVASSAPVPATWSPTDKAAAITLTNANKTATATGSTLPYNAPQAVRANVAIASVTKPVVWEVTLTALTQNWSAGVADGTYNLTAALGAGSDVHSIGCYPSTGAGSQPPDTVFYNNNQLTVGNGVSSANGDVMSFAVNGENLFFSTPSMRTTAGVTWNNLTTADPVANTGGFPFASIGQPFFPLFEEGEAPGSATLNDGTSAFSAFLTAYQAAHPGATVSLSNQGGAPIAKSIVPNLPTNVIAGAPFTFSGTIIGYSPNVPGLTYSANGQAPIILPGVTATGWSTTLNVATVGSYTIVVSDGSGTTGQVTFLAAAAQTGGSGVFSTNAAGQVIDPHGVLWEGRGCAINEGDLPAYVTNAACQPLTDRLPGIKIIRLACYGYFPSTQYLQQTNWLTAAGIVLVYEDHQSTNGSNGGGAGVVFTNATNPSLASELAWYSALATQFNGNPYVWFGTTNEPSISPSVAALWSWQQSIYNTIRAVNPTCMIELEVGGVPSQWLGNPFVGGWTNIIWGPHFYGWVFNAQFGSISQANIFSSAPGVVTSWGGIVQISQSLNAMHNAQGNPIPVFCMEFGPGTVGTQDVSGNQTVDANFQAANAGVIVGWAAWTISPGNLANTVTNNTSQLQSPYGVAVASQIANQTGGI